jgi:hypothetical protein
VVGGGVRLREKSLMSIMVGCGLSEGIFHNDGVLDNVVGGVICVVVARLRGQLVVAVHHRQCPPP